MMATSMRLGLTNQLVVGTKSMELQASESEELYGAVHYTSNQYLVRELALAPYGADAVQPVGVLRAMAHIGHDVLPQMRAGMNERVIAGVDGDPTVLFLVEVQ